MKSNRYLAGTCCFRKMYIMLQNFQPCSQHCYHDLCDFSLSPAIWTHFFLLSTVEEDNYGFYLIDLLIICWQLHEFISVRRSIIYLVKYFFTTNRNTCSGKLRMSLHFPFSNKPFILLWPLIALALKNKERWDKLRLQGRNHGIVRAGEVYL